MEHLTCPIPTKSKGVPRKSVYLQQSSSKASVSPTKNTNSARKSAGKEAKAPPSVKTSAMSNISF